MLCYKPNFFKILSAKVNFNVHSIKYIHSEISIFHLLLRYYQENNVSLHFLFSVYTLLKNLKKLI